MTPTEAQTNMGHFCKSLQECCMKKKKQFAISFAGPFDVFRSVPVSKFEQDPGGYNVEQIKTWFKFKDLQRIKAEWIMRGLLSTVS